MGTLDTAAASADPLFVASIPPPLAGYARPKYHTMNQDIFKDALGRYASGVTIITTLDPAGDAVGLTATSFASVSLDPPLVLFCLAHSANCFDAFERADAFAVNILAHGQDELSNRFASREGDKFKDASTKYGSLGSPYLDGALVCMDCSILNRHPGGDHVIYIGQVKQVELGAGAPLLYFQGKYHTV